MPAYPSSTSSTSGLASYLVADVAADFADYPRLSAPLISPDAAHRLGSAAAVLAQASVRVLGLSWCQDHYVFMLHVDTGVERFVVHRRFAEFRRLRQDLRRALADDSKHAHAHAHCTGICRQIRTQLATQPFPHRHMPWRFADPQQRLDLARDRLAPLQHFLQALLQVYTQGSRRAVRRCLTMQCPVLRLLATFLNLPTLTEAPTDSLTNEKEGASSPSETLASSLGDSGGFRHARDLPPTTRVSLDAEALQQEQLFPISEDVQLLHVA